MLAFGDARLGDVDGHLAGVQRMHKLRETAAVVHVHLQREGYLLFGKIAEVGAVEFLGKAARRDLRDQKRPGLLRKLVEQVHDVAQRGFVRRRHIAVAAILHREDAQAIELAAMLLAAKAGDHLVHQVVDIEQLEFHRTVVHRVGQVVRHRVAEGRDGTVVVRTAPFSEKIRETIHQHLRACILAIVQEQVLPCFLAAAVLRVAETARQRSLLRRGEHHRAGVPVRPQPLEQSRSEPEVPLHEFRNLLGPVHSREIEHEIALRAPDIQFLRRGVKVIFIHLRDCHAIIPCLSVADVLQLCAQVLAHEPLCASHQDPHYFTMLGIPLSSFWIYSSEAILALVSSRFSRRVLSELNSSMVARLASPSLKYLS